MRRSNRISSFQKKDNGECRQCGGQMWNRFPGGIHPLALSDENQEVPVQVLDGSTPGGPVAVWGFDRETILVANAPAQEFNY
jgi:hypothetical protein